MTFSLTIVLIGVTVLVSYRAFQDANLRNKLIHHPYTERQDNGQLYRLVSHGFIHADMMHLLFNMFVFWSFGTQVERDFNALYGSLGNVAYVLMYLLGIVAGAMPSYQKQGNNPSYAGLGASGGVATILFAFIFLHPWAPLQFLFFPFFDIPAIVVGVFYLIYEWNMDKKGRTNIAHDAHFAGAIFGIIFLAVSRPSTIAYFFEQFLAGLWT